MITAGMQNVVKFIYLVSKEGKKQVSCKSMYSEKFSDDITPLKYRINTKENSCGKVISLFLED